MSPDLKKPTRIGYAPKVGTVRVGEIRFRVYPQDHEPIHVHGFIGSGEVIVMLFADGTVGLDDRDDAVRRARVRRSARFSPLPTKRTQSSLPPGRKMHPDE